MNRQTYIASVENVEVIHQILAQVRRIENKTLSRKLPCPIPEKSLGGILYLQRFVQRRETRKKKNKNAKAEADTPKKNAPITLETHPYCVEDIYWLSVLDETGKQVLDVHHDSASCSYAETGILQRPDLYLAGLTEYFPQPDEIVVDWHDLAELLNLNHSLAYVQAICSAASIHRPVWASSASFTHQRIYQGPYYPPNLRDSVPARYQTYQSRLITISMLLAIVS